MNTTHHITPFAPKQNLSEVVQVVKNHKHAKNPMIDFFSPRSSLGNTKNNKRISNDFIIAKASQTHSGIKGFGDFKQQPAPEVNGRKVTSGIGSADYDIFKAGVKGEVPKLGRSDGIQAMDKSYQSKVGNLARGMPKTDISPKSA